MDRPLLILSDTHLSRDYGASVGEHLATLLKQHRNCEVILNGDIVDLSLDDASTPLNESLHAGLAPHTAFVEALRKHVVGGGKLTIVPGNHDASLSHVEQTTALRQLLGAPSDDSVEIAPWFVRRAGVHIEHGHLYDPDCAPNHPLADPNPMSEGLGTALMRRFVAPNDAIFFAHANQTTPSSGLRTAFEKWGARAPVVIADYFNTAFKLCAEAWQHRPLVSDEKRQGDDRLEHHAERSGLARDHLDSLLSVAPPPTHHSLRETFFRLYFDRIFAGCSLATGIALLGAAGLSGGLAPAALFTASGGLTSSGALLSLLGGGYLGQSVLREKNRYGDLVISHVGEAAHQVREITDSRLVVLGHTHVEVDEPGYVNLGSFGFGSRHPHLLVATDGSHERRYASG